MAKVSKSIIIGWLNCPELLSKLVNWLDSFWHKDEKIPFSALETDPSEIFVSQEELEIAIAKSAYGIKYTWSDSTERDAQSGMVALEQGVQQDNRTVYSYNGASWEEFYTLDPLNWDDRYYTKTQIDAKILEVEIQGARVRKRRPGLPDKTDLENFEVGDRFSYEPVGRSLEGEILITPIDLDVDLAEIESTKKIKLYRDD